MLNPLKLLYYYNYYESKKRGDEANALKYGNISVIVVFAFLLLSFYVFFVLNFPRINNSAFGRFFTVFPADISGKILGIVPMIVGAIIVLLTYGKQKKYDKIIAAFNKLRPDEQERLAKKGYWLMFGSTIFLLFSMLSLQFI